MCLLEALSQVAISRKPLDGVLKDGIGLGLGSQAPTAQPRCQVEELLQHQEALKRGRRRALPSLSHARASESSVRRPSAIRFSASEQIASSSLKKMRRSQADAKRGEGWGHLFVASASCMAAEGRRRKEESPLQGFGGGGGGGGWVYYGIVTLIVFDYRGNQRPLKNGRTSTYDLFLDHCRALGTLLASHTRLPILVYSSTRYRKQRTSHTSTSQGTAVLPRVLRQI